MSENHELKIADETNIYGFVKTWTRVLKGKTMVRLSYLYNGKLSTKTVLIRKHG